MRLAKRCRNIKDRFPTPGKKRGEEGFILVTSLLVLLVLVIIGISATTNTTIELQIAGNAKEAQKSFYLADSGINVSPHLIATAVEDGAPPTGVDLGAVRYVAGDNGTSLYRQIMGYDSYNGGTDNQAAREFAFNSGNNKRYGITIDVKREEAVHQAGGGVEFAAGAEGAGTGSSGGVAVQYRLKSFSSGPQNTASVEAGYLKVTGMAEGG
ncbi:MAG: PilX N-terminal domain-containing pilus assembly protein [Desulfobia sp.]